MGHVTFFYLMGLGGQFFDPANGAAVAGAPALPAGRGPRRSPGSPALAEYPAGGGQDCPNSCQISNASNPLAQQHGLQRTLAPHQQSLQGRDRQIEDICGLGRAQVAVIV